MQAIWLVVAIAVGIVVTQLNLPTALSVIGISVLIVLTLFSPYVTLILLLTFAPMRTLIATESTIQLPLDIGQILTVIFIAWWLLSRISLHHKLLNLKWSTIHYLVLIFVVATEFTVFSAVSLSAWLNDWLKWLLILVLSLLIANYVRNREWELVVFGLTIAGVANALVGIYIFLGGSGALHLLINNRFFRAFGTFGQPNPFGGFMGLLFPLAGMMSLGYLLIVWNKWLTFRKINIQVTIISTFFGVSAMLLALGVIISWSRGAWLSLGVSSLVMAILLPKRWWQSVLMTTSIVIVVGLLWFSGRFPASIQDRIDSATEELFTFNDVRAVDITSDNYAVVERLAHWQAALNMAQYNPWLGVGIGNYEIAYDEYRLINWDEPLGHAHNYYLNVLAETGIIGALCYIFMWLGLASYTLQLRRHPDIIARSMGIGIMGTWTYLAVHSLTDNLYVNNIFLHIGIIIGLLVILHEQIQPTVITRALWHNHKQN